MEKALRIEHEVPFDYLLDLLHNEFGRAVVIQYQNDLGQDVRVETEVLYDDMWDEHEEEGLVRCKIKDQKWFFDNEACVANVHDITAGTIFSNKQFKLS